MYIHEITPLRITTKLWLGVNFTVKLAARDEAPYLNKAFVADNVSAVLYLLWPLCHIYVNLLQQEGEDAVQFANRVKAAIARQGGLVDLLW